MVFAGRRTGVCPSEIPAILEDDGYRQTTWNESEHGDVVLYRDSGCQIVHVALVIEKVPCTQSAQFEITVLSQWGFSGEFFHDIRDVTPMYGHPTDFWTDRVA